MSLAPGTRLGPHEVVALVGAGGMGEVYRARDTKLAREVALKILPDAFASDADRLQRFRREAQVLASLNHPNIAQIYGFEEAKDVHALVMELVDGPTLADRIARGQIPVDEALPIAKQIAEALEAAHEQGIIHRDLKPANIKVRNNGTVKVLDFGLAKAIEPAGANHIDVSQSPTITSPAMTHMGMILGTASYMSPEQARGEVVDRGTDIWAFGCVLYEMLTGRRAFGGQNVSDTLASILRDEPAWSQLPPETPSVTRRVLRRCLEKDRRRRLADIRDARLDLEESGTETAHVSTRRSPTLWIERLASVLVLGLVSGLALWLALPHEAVPSQTEMRVEFRTFPTVDRASLAISPDGLRVAFVAIAEGRSLLWVRRLDTGEVQEVRGSDGASFPFWSPDSRSIAFFATERLKRVSLDGSLPVVLAPAIVPAGGAWGRDGRILYPIVPDSHLMVVSADGGFQQPKLAPGGADDGTGGGQRFPQVLPDGRHYLYYVAESRSNFLGSFDRPDRRRLFEADAAAVVAPPSEVLFVRGGVLYAQKMDMTSFALLGEPVALAKDIGVTGGAMSVSASSVGSIAYRMGSALSPRQLMWFDRTGRGLGTIGDADPMMPRNPSLSFDGRRLALNRSIDGNTDLFVSDATRGISQRFTDAPPPEIAPVWSPDGRAVLFSQGIPPKNRFAIHVLSIEGGGKAQPIVGPTPEVQIAMDWRAGRVLYRTVDNQNGWDIWSAQATGDPRPQRLVGTRFDERSAQFSPDASWVAYESNKTGTYEIYLHRSAEGGEEIPVSKGGGLEPRWSPDGNELFYLAPDGWLIAVNVKRTRAGELVLGTPQKLFATNTYSKGGDYSFSVGPDGRRFLVIQFVEQPQTPISLIVNRRR